MIETERLILRPLAIDDFANYVPFWSVLSMSGAFKSPLPALDEEQIWARLLRWIGHWHIFGFGPFVAVDRTTGEVCGEVGFASFKRGHGASFDAAPEALWKISNHHQGKGLAREAMSACFDWFDARPAFGRAVCMIDPTNHPSVALAGKLGFREFGRGDYHGVELILFERMRPSL